MLRIGQYDAEETLERLRHEQGVLKSDIEVTESNYVCMAEYLARDSDGPVCGRAPAQATLNENLLRGMRQEPDPLMGYEK